MKPPKFRYHAPTSLDEAVTLLQRYDGDARPLAGGQSMVPMLNFRLMAPAALIDLSRIPDLDYVREDGNDIAIGGMARQRTVENSPLVVTHLPLLREALQWVGHLPTRSRGTVCGSLAHADPASEQPMAMLALDGSVVARGPAGSRVIPASEFFVSLFTTALEPDEILIEARLPKMAPDAGYAVEEFARRHGDFAIAVVAVALRRDGDRCIQASVAAAGVDATPIRLRSTEAALLRDGLSAEAIESACREAGNEVDPTGDVNASAEFRKHLVSVLAARAVSRAAERAGIAK